MVMPGAPKSFPPPLPFPKMSHYIYALYTCCSEPQEYDFVDLLDVTYCNHCPLSADNTLYNGDFFHCPYVTAEYVGDSVYMCEECSSSAWIRDNDHEVDWAKISYYSSPQISEAESEGDEFETGE